VNKIKPNILVPDSMPIYGYIYDVKTSSLIEVCTTTTAGKEK